ncbi:hypothetical protein FisN_14Lu209 [Fistulifera solaris]|uniref:Uncharacterized protein n=1 Tax=Fistulifera solaris TaxID=1519565 RepID=A0A1Z5J9K9_FISSO|nr:hypothetical protein FisN_14Lu209 [Fistulifera solaris]|eukprot:GAX10693.1 hypothetical protein FisN_14Lu209 [Fistulifera solaris]
MMIDTLPAANSTSSQKVPFGRKLAVFFFQLIYLDFVIVFTWIFVYACCIIPFAVFWTFVTILAILLYALLIAVDYANNYERNLFYYKLRPYEVGDLVEIDPTEESVCLKA